MKKFLIQLLLFIICLVFVDFVIGYSSEFLRENALGGSTANNYYIANYSQDDIMILGSSRATHHYIPQIIEDSLNLSCYNYGEEGNGIILAYGRYLMVTDRHIPKLIIYEVTPEYDYGNKESNEKYLRYLRQYYSHEDVKHVMNRIIDNKEKIKMLSQMYRNNSMMLPALLDNIIYRDIQKGYSPMFGIMKNIKDDLKEEDGTKIDSVKKELFEEFIADVTSRKIPLIMMVSPQYKGGNCKQYDFAKQLCEKYNVQFISYMNNHNFSDQIKYFHDKKHMNHEGAKAFTNAIIPLLKESLNR